MIVQGEKLIGQEVMHHVLPEPGESLEQLALRLRAQGHINTVFESGGILLHFHQERYLDESDN